MDNIIAVDPGRDKCGVAVLDPSGTVLYQKVVKTDDLMKIIGEQLEACGELFSWYWKARYGSVEVFGVIRRTIRSSSFNSIAQTSPSKSLLVTNLFIIISFPFLMFYACMFSMHSCLSVP